jgi:DNA-binding NarL/FixJ family response regulator
MTRRRRLVNGSPPTGRTDWLGTLTPRESEVRSLVAQGLSDAAIAGALGVSRVPVTSHIHRTLAKRGLSSRRQAAAPYYQHGIPRRASYLRMGDELRGGRFRPAAG